MRLLVLFLCLVSFPAWASDRDLTHKSVNELEIDGNPGASGDYYVRYDASDNAFKRVDAFNAEFTVLGTTATADEISRNNDTSNRLVFITSDETLTEADYEGYYLILDNEGLATVTLPAATGSGGVYRFIVGTVNTSKYVIQAAGNDTIDGNIFVNTDNASDAVIGFNPGASDSTITLNGTTSGGASVGDKITYVDIAEDQWVISGLLTASGTEINPSSTAAQ